MCLHWRFEHFHWLCLFVCMQAVKVKWTGFNDIISYACGDILISRSLTFLGLTLSLPRYVQNSPDPCANIIQCVDLFTRHDLVPRISSERVNVFVLVWLEKKVACLNPRELWCYSWICLISDSPWIVFSCFCIGLLCKDSIPASMMHFHNDVRFHFAPGDSCMSIYRWLLYVLRINSFSVVLFYF